MKKIIYEVTASGVPFAEFPNEEAASAWWKEQSEATKEIISRRGAPDPGNLEPDLQAQLDATVEERDIQTNMIAEYRELAKANALNKSEKKMLDLAVKNRERLNRKLTALRKRIKSGAR